MAQAVMRLVDRVGMQEAALALGRSPRTLERLIRAEVQRQPLGRIIPSAAALRRWEVALDAAAAVTKPTITMRQFERLRTREADAQWRVDVQRFRRREEVHRRVLDYVSAGVPDSQVVIIREPGWYRVGRTRMTPRRRRS